MAEESSNNAAHTTPIQAGSVKKGSFVMLDGFPCKCVEISVSKTGKHGHAKASITGMGVIDGVKRVENCPTSHNMQAPVVVRSTYKLLDYKDDEKIVDCICDKGTVYSFQYNGDHNKLMELVPKAHEGETVNCTHIATCGYEKVFFAHDKQV